MFRTLSSLAVSGALAGLTAGAVVFQTPKAQAACIGGNSACTTFDPSSITSPTGISGFSGTFNPTQYTYSRAHIQFQLTGAWATPFTISGIKLTGQGIATQLSFSNKTIADLIDPSFDGNQTAFINLDTPLSSLDFSQNTISFDLPPGIAPIGATISARIQYSDSTGANINSSNNSFLTTSADPSSVPGPLPLLGAGAAFGFSRTLRKRIKSADQA